MSQLLQRLKLLSGEGKVDWQKSEGVPYSYEFVGAGGDKVVIDSRDDDGRGPFDLLVFNADGTLAGEARWSSDSSGVGSERDNQLLALYEMARDYDAGTIEVLDRLLKELPEPEIPF